MNGILHRLRGALPDDVVFSDPGLLESYRHDQATFVPAGQPAVLVRPRSTEDVQAVLRAAAASGTPVVPRGAGSGLSGGANAVDGCIVLSMERMNQILELDAAERIAVVQPGVVNLALRRAAAEQNLFYAPDPSSYDWSSIGGNVATNAGGLCCVKYGVTRDSVLALEVVLADGSVVRTGRRTLKGVAGYDLTSMFVGSEGTLGVVTEATLRLRGLPQPPLTAVAFFPTLASAGEAVQQVLALGLIPSLLEIMDQTTVQAVDDMTRMELDRDAAALLLAQFDQAGSGRDGDVRRLMEICEAAGASFAGAADDAAEGDALLAARRAALPALERRGAVLLDDVAVLPSRLCDLISAVERIADEAGLLIGTFGHAGDGNLHPTIVFDREDEAQVSATRAAFDRILVAALDLGGTITGEHGVGVLKREHLAAELGPTNLQLQRTLKRALDPLGILNPGKVIDTESAGLEPNS